MGKSTDEFFDAVEMWDLDGRSRAEYLGVWTLAWERAQRYFTLMKLSEMRLPSAREEAEASMKLADESYQTEIEKLTAECAALKDALQIRVEALCNIGKLVDDGNWNYPESIVRSVAQALHMSPTQMKRKLESEPARKDIEP